MLKKSRNSGSKKSLLNGEYDERGAQESFQQALMAWRKDGESHGGEVTKKRVQIVREDPPTNNNSGGRRRHNRDVVINCDLDNEEDKKRAVGIRELEAYITSNHTLSYADRLLLQKFRRNHAEFSGLQADEKSPTPDLDRSLRETVNFGWLKIPSRFRISKFFQI